MRFTAALMIVLSAACWAANEKEESEFMRLFSDASVHGFYEIRGGYRLSNDKHEKDMSLMEMRYQLDLSTRNEWMDIKLKGDIIGDLVEEQGDFDMREAYILTYPADFLDLKIGRQIITWGTGDMIFINDLFPKDWVSFFIGRDVEYLKAPSDAARASVYLDEFNIDLVYTPQFDPDRYITGRRISYFNPILGSIAGQNAIIRTDEPDEGFRDDEVAVRVYKNIDNYEVALYAYNGFWKSPGGFNDTLTRAVFPDLQVYGASVRGTVGKGIGNAEFGYYNSLDDSSGKDPLINNSELRFLLGYNQEVAKDFTAGVQYYLEYMMDYDEFVDSSPVSLPRDRDRHLTTLRLTKLLMNQNVALSMFTFYSPSDNDVYLRPNVNYKVSDNLMLEAGGNIFFGENKDTFFSQFQDNTNVYAAVRYSF